MDGQIPQDYVYALAASPAFEQDGVCFAAKASGLYRSLDGGKTWQDAFRSLNLQEPQAISSVALSPAFETDRLVLAGTKGGVLISSDVGETWEFVQVLPERSLAVPFITALALSPAFAQDRLVLAATDQDGVLRSTDGGLSWASWNFGLLDLRILCLAFSPGFAQDQAIYIGTESGIFASQTGGRAWSEVDFPMESAPVLSLALSPQFVSDGVLFAGTEQNGLFCSADRGNTWQGPLGPTAGEAVSPILLDPAYPAVGRILLGIGAGPLLSQDGGKTWAAWKAAWNPPAEVTALLAPAGLAEEAPIITGFMDGTIERL